MKTTQWLTAANCPLLQTEPAVEEASSPRLVQRFLGLCLARPEPPALLEEIATVLRADQAAVLEAGLQWSARWEYTRRGARPVRDGLPRALLGEVLDRSAGA